MAKLEALRERLKDLSVDLIIVGSEDAHQSEYVSARDLRRGFISDFTGSAGTAIITQNEALLWTDGRYFLQAEKELSSSWKLMRSGEKDVPDIVDWISNHLREGQTVGIDAWLNSASQAKRLFKSFDSKKIKLISFQENPVDLVWDQFGRPPVQANTVEVVPLERSGLSHQQKIEKLRSSLQKNNATAIVIAMLDEIAWLLNIRGSDIDFNPVVISYVIVTVDKVYWFVNPSKVTPEVRAHLGESVEVLDYEKVEEYLINASKTGKIWIDAARTNYRLYQAVGENGILEKTSPITLSKSLKTDEELRGFVNAHIRDGAALTAFIHWLETTVKGSPNSITEYAAAQKLEEFRGKMDLHVGPSFTTIAGFGSNGAIIHYSPPVTGSAPIGVDSLFLLDSGAQYRDGTTDVTRTMHFGTATERMRDCYTAVLKGHIALASIIIPEGTEGSRFDCVARTALWRLGLDYNHGTGHGVGVYLNVHEGPQGIGYRRRENEEGFYAGMTISNEPGYYENGAFGIRIENLCVTRHAKTANNFSGKKFLEFETVTLVPIKTDLINVEQLDDAEIRWVNSYHQQVRDRLTPLMQQYFPETVEYLVHETRPISK